MKNITTLGIDLAKNIFYVYGMDKHGKKIVSKFIKRADLMTFIAQLPPCLIGIEACCGAHFWTNQFQKHGHTVKMMHPAYVKPFVQVHKNDRRDAEAIAMAASLPSISAVTPKTVNQLDLQALSNVREGAMKTRTALGNQMRGLLAERGIVLREGHTAIRHLIPLILEDADNGLSITSRQLIDHLRQEWHHQHELIEKLTSELEQFAKSDEACQQIQTIPGIGPIVSTALISHMGNGSGFATGRHLAASIGIVPRQHSSGGRDHLLGISKQGNKYLRKQLIHGARAAYQRFIKDPESSRLGQWIKGMEGKHPNKIIVALANKMVRIAWACLKKGTTYQANYSL